MVNLEMVQPFHKFFVMIKSWEDVVTPFSFSEKKKLSNRDINKTTIREVNRGVELILNGGKKQKKPFHIIFDQMVSFFNREVTIYFEFSLTARKKN